MLLEMIILNFRGMKWVQTFSCRLLSSVFPKQVLQQLYLQFWPWGNIRENQRPTGVKAWTVAFQHSVLWLFFYGENNINNADKKQLKKYPPTYSLQIAGEKKQLGGILITLGTEMLIFNSFYKRFVVDTHQLV